MHPCQQTDPSCQVALWSGARLLLDKLDLESGPITIHNIYSEIPGSYDTIAWNTLIPQMLEAIKVPGRHLVVSDFNLHYTM
jgi:hypothetical protein